MSAHARWRGLFALLAALVVAFAVAACGSDNNNSSDSTSSGSSSANLIKSNPANGNVSLTVGSKNFDEEFFLGQVYSQALQAAGYQVKTALNLGDEHIAVKEIEAGQISGYPEYTSTALTSLFGVKPEDVPADATEAVDSIKPDLAAKGLVGYPPAPYNSANAVGLLKTTADELGVTKISDLEGKSQDLTLYGTTECPQRVDCLVGLEQGYGLKFKDFQSVDPELRYSVLDKGQADLSIVYTSDGQLAASDKYTVLEDDKHILPAGNPFFIASQKVADQAGPDFGATIENVQKGLTLPVVQEALKRISLDKEEPAAVAADYLKAGGYTQ
jgi:glycine betaine/choline ABC-type transport system substrate-binding protein